MYDRTRPYFTREQALRTTYISYTIPFFAPPHDIQYLIQRMNATKDSLHADSSHRHHRRQRRGHASQSPDHASGVVLLRQNPTKFRHRHGESARDFRDIEKVMDLRPNVAVKDMDASSLASLRGGGSIDGIKSTPPANLGLLGPTFRVFFPIKGFSSGDSLGYSESTDDLTSIESFDLSAAMDGDSTGTDKGKGDGRGCCSSNSGRRCLRMAVAVATTVVLATLVHRATDSSSNFLFQNLFGIQRHLAASAMESFPQAEEDAQDHKLQLQSQMMPQGAGVVVLEPISDSVATDKTKPAEKASPTSKESKQKDMVEFDSEMTMRERNREYHHDKWKH